MAAARLTRHIFETELVVRFARDRRAYPAICLAGDGGILATAGNDYGFDEIFRTPASGLWRAG
jgi:phosphoheptose isomerase